MPTTETKPLSVHGIPVPPDTLMDHYIAVTKGLEPVLPLLDGALHFTPTSLCYGNKEHEERLTDRGRAFVGIVRQYLEEAMSAARAVGHLATAEPHVAEFANRVRVVWDETHMALLVAHALADPELPDSMSGHDGIEFIRERVRDASEAMEAMKAIAYRAQGWEAGDETEDTE